MMNLFSNLKVYGGKWSVKSTRKFTNGEVALVDKAQVVDSQYGSSVCFFMKNGTTTYVPLSNDSKAQVGDVIQLSEAEIVTLEKQGEADIQRIKA